MDRICCCASANPGPVKEVGQGDLVLGRGKKDVLFSAKTAFHVSRNEHLTLSSLQPGML